MGTFTSSLATSTNATELFRCASIKRRACAALFCEYYIDVIPPPTRTQVAQKQLHQVAKKPTTTSLPTVAGVPAKKKKALGLFGGLKKKAATAAANPTTG
jgi:hypothetical protein